jgi:quaternary ammonium compound-resistance protein SugE
MKLPTEWIQLLGAGALEVAWAVGLKYARGFTRPWPSAFTVAAMVASMLLLALAIRRIPLGTGYAVWTGIGAVGTAVFGILLFAESSSVTRLLFIAMIVAGIVGLKATA